MTGVQTCALPICRSGSRINKAGERVDKVRKVKQNVGAQEGKGTWGRVLDTFNAGASKRWIKTLEADWGRIIRGK